MSHTWKRWTGVLAVTIPAPPKVDLWKVRRMTEHHLSVAFRLTAVVEGSDKPRNVEYVDLSALESPSFGDITVRGAEMNCRYETRLRGLDVKSTQVDFVRSALDFRNSGRPLARSA